MDIKKQPGIKFDNIILIKSYFSREAAVPTDNDVKATADFKVNWNKKTNNLEMTAEIKLVKETTVYLTLTCTFVGLFSVIPGEENMNIETFMTQNAPALMLPYIREYVSTTTLKAGVKPIMIAPLNIIALINKDKKDKEVKKPG